MRILFCNIAWMNYYKGIVWGKDEPQNGGSYVKETLDAHEKYNFEAIPLTEESGYPKGKYCLGFVETKSTNKETRNQLRIEKIYDCEGMNEETSVDDVLVVYLDAGIIVELKYVRSLNDLDQACERALEQIEDRRYDTELREDGRNDIFAYEIAFCRKRCKVVVKNL